MYPVHGQLARHVTRLRVGIPTNMLWTGAIGTEMAAAGGMHTTNTELGSATGCHQIGGMQGNIRQVNKTGGTEEEEGTLQAVMEGACENRIMSLMILLKEITMAPIIHRHGIPRMPREAWTAVIGRRLILGTSQVTLDPEWTTEQTTPHGR